MKEIKEIKICMGSSCFARGNNKNLDFIEDYLKKNKLAAKIELIGSRCENKCSKGPNLIIDGQEYQNVTLENLKVILGNE